MPSTHTATVGRSPDNPNGFTLEVRRLVRFERHYRCASCGAECSSWARIAACSDCGVAFVAATIRRAAVVAV